MLTNALHRMRVLCMRPFLYYPATWANTRHLNIFGGWMLFCKELVVVEDSPHIGL